MWQAICEQLSDTLMFSYQIIEKEKLNGGDISDCYMISDGNQRYFVKINSKDFYQKFEIEAENLRCLRETSTIDVPECILTGCSKDNAFIILNYLPTKPLDDGKASRLFGEQLAELHLWGEQKEYGFDQDNFIGSSLQPNQWDRKWSRFFAEQRIGWQLQLLREKGVNLIDISDFTSLIQNKLANHQPKPSLLHGDLWYGNCSRTVFGPLCYDPACYWGDRECDLAMTELFGGFQPDFYQGYESIAPLNYGYEERKDIYNLYHILNHCNQFGGHYLDSSEALIKRILSL
ncbi:fructosamine kinase family protein [Vibrio caribbeanicus]|uniref:fructosamine kinase family protein n=1 Tax=Vibrio caribbeanicus TaxID=701175 RepID=UPI0022841244|nr:fructosamine kinase family protein [Vibrio caribbeanicus]MCY9843204.1 fructosamine kinase family protein [Vibrio caribbeanicus]